MNVSVERFRPFMLEEEFKRLKKYNSVSEMWTDCVSSYSSTVAIEDDGRKYTYSDLEKRAAALRGALSERGCVRGMKIGLYAENSFDFAAAFIAISTLGTCAVILPPHLQPEAVMGCSAQFSLGALVCTPSLSANCRLACEKLSLPLVCTDTDSAFPLYALPCSEEEACAIVFTGGTTGKSKGALLSNRAVMQGVFNGCLGVKHIYGARYLLAIPLSHVFGLIRNLLTCLSTGSTMYICRNNQDLFRDIACFRPTILILVPALAELALSLSKKFGRNMLGDDIKTIICGAAAVPPYLISEYYKMGIELYPGYGLTETANLVSGNPDNLGRPDSVGLPYPDQELKIVDGELWLRGRNIMDRYVGAAGESSFTDDGWFRTGDLVRIDSDGYLYITGRLKEIIVLPSGENISPAELEAYFLVCPLVQDCQIFEDIDENGRHILALEAVPRAAEMAKLPADEASSTMLEELELINSRLPSFQRLNRISIRERDFERTKSMKIVRYKKCE